VYVCLLYQGTYLLYVPDTINTHTQDSSPDTISTHTQDSSPDTINTHTQDSSPYTTNTHTQDSFIYQEIELSCVFIVSR
jgi:hypothetical protein